MDHSTLARANENRDWRIYADFGSYLINLVKPLYTENHLLLSGIDEDILVLSSTTISVSLTLMGRAHGKYSRGAVKMHTLLNLRGGIPTFIYISDGKYHDVNALDEIEIVPGTIYVMDKAYIDFGRLFRLAQSNAFFVVRAKSNLKFKAVASRKVDKNTGLRCDQSIRLSVAKSIKQYPGKIRRIKYSDSEKDITLVLPTNNFDMESLEVTAVYKKQLADRGLFQMDKTEPSGKNPLGPLRECGEDPFMDSNMHILDRSILKTTNPKAVHSL